MALTPEDVVNKRFLPTKRKEGYDQDEVDDFLDEVVVELRRLGQENDDLRQRLVSTEAQLGAPTAADEPAPDQGELVPAAFDEATTEAAQPVSSETETEAETASTTNLLQLARRLHEDHVKEGIARRDALIAEGHASRDEALAAAEEAAQQALSAAEADRARIIADAEADRDRVVADGVAQAEQTLLDADAKQRELLVELDEARAALQDRVDELQAFESEYRSRLKTFIEGQLRDLDDTARERERGDTDPDGRQGLVDE